ncbi:hypothetical protein Adt_11372 [Abeliophyllum distichum]|uniref:Uncharacterized protein n=1 Tax=Abeliophyllum distichum TaxID=126358 RepID=A0ABD1UMN1_9LAMI
MQDAGPSSGKRKAPSKKTSKQPVTYNDTKFETEGAWLVYRNDTSIQNIIPERRVLTSNFANELLGHVIERNKWETFVAPPRVAHVEIVKELYANIHDNLDNPEHPQYRQVYMREQYILFSPLAILRYYGLDNTETDIFQAATTNLHEVVASVCQGIDLWPDGSSTLHYKCLLPQVRTLDKMGNLPGETEPAQDDPMAEDLHETVTEPTLASISHELIQWRTSQVELEA